MTELAFSSAADAGFHPERLARITSVLQADIDAKRLPGAVALVARGGKLAYFESLGLQAPNAIGAAATAPMAKDSIFRIYSMTKPIVSVAVMMLAEQGKLLLSQPVAKYLPEFAKQHVAVHVNGVETVEDVKTPATIQDLLRHTAGLTYEFLGVSSVQRAYGKTQIGSRKRTNDEFSKALAELPLAFQPGTMWEYSRATDVLGCLLERVTGQTLAAHLSEAIFEPLGMVDTSFAVGAENHHRIAEPFAQDPDGQPMMRVFDPREQPTLESGGGGLMSTAMDYARFMQFLRNKGELNGTRLLASSTIDYMTADHLPGLQTTGTLLPAGHGFGLGFAVRTHAGVANAPGSVGQYFWGGLAGTTFFVDPALDLYATLLVQAPNQREHYRELFRNLVYAAVA